MIKQNWVILSGVLLFCVILLVSYVFFDNSKKEIEIAKKQVEFNMKNEILDNELKTIKVEKDSLEKVIISKDSLINLKKDNIKLIKPKYDKKINSVTTSPADTISKFLLNRYR